MLRISERISSASPLPMATVMVLGKQIQRLQHGTPHFDAAREHGFAGGGEFDEFQRIRRHAEHATGLSGRWPLRPAR